jgi:hypothetical protein
MIRILREYEAGGSSPEPVAALTPPVLSGNLGLPLIPGQRWGRVTFSHPMTCGLTPFGKGHLNRRIMRNYRIDRGGRRPYVVA